MDKTFNAAEAEARIDAMWRDRGAFAAGANAKPGKPAFSIVIPPPNVTGSLHMGHAFNNTLQDILTRWHRMRGHDVLWQPGTDHAGIATQMVVERELEATNRRRTDMPRDEFIGLVWEQKRKSRGHIIGQLQRLGASCDWSREAFTMGGAPGDPDDTEANFHDAVQRVFVDFYNRGLIYRGKRLVNWDPKFETAISDLEVENTEVPGQMWHFKYPLANGATYTYRETDDDGNVLMEEERDYISIATTRPETMLGDGAVAVHPSDPRYAPIVGQLCEIPVGPKEHRRLIPIITDDYPDPDFGSGAVKITGAHDFNDYAVAKRAGIPLYRLMDTKAQMRADGADYAADAEIAMAVAKGERTLTESETDAINLVPKDYRGLDRFEARKRIVADITDEGLAVMVPSWDERLGKAATRDTAPEEGGDLPPEDQLVPLVEKRPMMQPFGDRSKTVIEPMLTDQWFVDAEKIVGPAIDQVEKGRDRADGSSEGTAILPERDARVYLHWLNNIEPWCISRQLWWGHRIPVWYGPPFVQMARPDIGRRASDNSAHLFCAATFDEARKLAAAAYGSWIDEEEADPKGNLPQFGFELGEDDSVASVTLSRDPDVLDTWFSSGIWPLGTLGWPDETEALERYFPTSVLVTGFDIIFFWVARMMMMQHEILNPQDENGQRHGDPEAAKPFHDVYVHALVRDAAGKKMSKSLGNVMDPIDLIDDYGADAVRFTLTAMAAMGRDLKLSTDRIAGYRNFGTKLWNAVRFAEMNDVVGSDKSPMEFRQVSDARQTANRWILGETARIRETVDAALGAYRFNDAANALYAFVWGRVCDWYVEFAKPLLASDDPEIVAETRAVMAWVLDRCMILSHPFMPFVTEELWALTADRGSAMLVHADWPEDMRAADIADEKADAEMTWVLSLIEDIRSVRAQMRVPAGAHLPLLKLDLDTQAQAAWDRNETLIKRLARVESLSNVSELPKGAVTLPVEGGTFALPLADVIDVAEERARLDKTLAKLDKDINGLSGRLDNPRFLENAKEGVVEETRDTLAAKQDERAKLQAALDRVSELA